MQTEQAQTRTFYSKACHLGVTIKNEVVAIENGVVTRTGGKTVEFQPLGDGYGWYNTADPEEIAALQRSNLVLSPEQYTEMTTPDAVKVQLAREETQRLIEDRNRLQADLDEIRSKAVKPAPAKTS